MGAKKILLVDDDEAVADGLKRLAENAGVVLTIAPNGKEALRKIKSEDGGFSHIIVDCILPEDNGVALSKTLKEANQSRYKKQKVYLTSGIVNPSLLGESIDHVDSFLPKPIDRDALNKLLEKQDKNLEIKDLFKNPPDLENIIEVYNESTFNDGYDLLPLIFGLSWLDFCGFVDLKYNNEMMSLKYDEQLSRITGTETSSSLGEVLAFLGFLNQNDLKTHLASEDYKKSNMRIGQHLIVKNLISPHSIDVAVNYQLQQLLISLLEKTDIQVTISQTDSSENNSKGQSIYSLFSCIENHINGLKELPSSDSREFLNSLDLKIYETDKTFILDGNKNNLNLNTNDKKFKYLLLSLFAGALNEYKDKDLEISDEELDVLEKRLALDDPFQVFDLNSTETTDKEIAKKYHSLARKYHPDKISSLNLDADLKKRSWLFFSKLTTEFNKIKTTEKRNNLLLQKETVEKKQAEQVRNMTTQLFNQLLKSEFSKAAETLERIRDLKNDHENDFLTLLEFWCDHKNKKETNINQINSILESVSEEKQLTEIKTYVKSIVELLNGNLEGCARQLNMCLNLNPTFLPARRDLIELKSLKKAQNKKKSSLSSLFSFKKSS